MIRLCALFLRVALVSLVGLVANPLKRLLRHWRMESWRDEHGGPPDEVLESFNDDGVTKEVTVFKGKLTYTMLAGWLVSIAARVFGDGVLTAGDLTELGEAVAAGVAIYGRWRATKQ